MAALVDKYGRPLEMRRKPEAGQQAVLSLRDRWSGYPTRGLTPERLAAILQEADEGDIERQAELFEEMEEKDTHLASVLQTRKLAVLGLPRAILPGGKDAAAQRAADLVSDVFARVGIADVLFDLLDATGKGMAACEIQWELAGDQVLPRAVEWVHPKRFRWADDGTLRLRTDRHPATGETLAANKWLVHVCRARSGWPSRAGMLRVCAWMYLFKNYAVKDWVVFSERMGIPTRVGKYDPSTSKEDKEALALALRMLGSDTSGIISRNTDIQFIESSATRGQEVFATLVAWCEAGMSKAVLGQTLTTEVGATGSFAASKTHDAVRRDLMEADALALAAVVQRDLVRPLVGFNLGWDVPLPVLEFDAREPEDLESLARTYGELVERVKLPIGKRHLYERFGVPEPAPDEEVVGGAAPVAAGAALCACSGQRSPVMGRLDGLADAAVAESGPAIAALVDPLRAAVAAASDWEDLQRRLLESYRDQDPSALEDLVGRALYVADLAGRSQ